MAANALILRSTDEAADRSKKSRSTAYAEGASKRAKLSRARDIVASSAGLTAETGPEITDPRARAVYGLCQRADDRDADAIPGSYKWEPRRYGD